jgi:hypothetical protein
MLLASFAFTPLQSAIFRTGTTTRSIPVDMAKTGHLIPLSEQNVSLNTNFFNAAYEIAWLGQDAPEYTTLEYAVLPFQPVSDHVSTYDLETRSTNATAFSTSLTCSEAEMSQEDSKYSAYNFSNGRGCSVVLNLTSLIWDDRPGYIINYIGYFEDVYTGLSLKQSDNCTAEHSNSFLALWSSPLKEFSDPSVVLPSPKASFCTPSYAAREMSITVNASNHGIVSGQLKPAASTTSETHFEEIFNITAFEYFLAVGYNQLQGPANFEDMERLQQYPRAQKMNVTFPITGLVGFALALSSSSASDYSSSQVMHDEFQRVHRLLFTAAFSTLTQKAHNDNIKDQIFTLGTIQDNLGSIILVRSIAIAVEAILGLTISMSIALWLYLSHRPNNLRSDPKSIANLMKMIRQSDVHHFPNHVRLSADDLKKSLRHTRFKLAKDGARLLRLESPVSDKPSMSQMIQTTLQVIVWNNMSPGDHLS